MLNDNFMIGADRRSRMGVNNEDDDEEPLVIVADTDPNQPMVWRSSSGEKMVFKRWREMVKSLY